MPGHSEFKINNKFANKYDKYRQKEELQRLKDKYWDHEESGSSESSSEDENVELDPEVERDFYRTLSLLKKKDPKIYQQDAKFYADAPSDDAKPSTSKTAVKPMYLKDYERKVILEKEGKYEDDDDSDGDDEEAVKRRERAASPTYIQEQKRLKESFQKFIQDDDDDDAPGQGESELLTRRVKTQDEKDKEHADYLDWLKGQAELEGPEEVKDMKHLRDYWNDPKLDEKERFLRDYVLNKGYLDNDDEDRIPTYDEVIQDDVDDSEEEGEDFLKQQQAFERTYNFRFEEPGAQQIKTYPRTIATSVRSKDDSRKRKREEVKDRKEKEKEHKREQLKQLKNLKRSEIMDKLKKLQELTGNEDLAFSHTDLEGEFDPQQHDQLMQKYFGDEYYGENEDKKPQFEDDEEFEERWNWDTWTGEENHDHDQEAGEPEGFEPHCDDQDFVMDADYDPSQHVASKKKKKERKKLQKMDLPQMGKKKKKSLFAEAVTTAKPVFDPNEKSFQQYLDEYYKLDYEDIIDDLPCRFRYRQVLANDFGLSVDEILKANDKDLNRWASLKKTCMFRSDREEMCELKNYQIKSQNSKKKREILVSVYSEDGQEVQEEQRETAKNDDRASTGETSAQLSSNSPAAVEAEEDEDDEVLVPKKKIKVDVEKTAVKAAVKKNKKRFHQTAVKTEVKIGGREFSSRRLKAYGLNPKRLFFRQLGRQRRKDQQKMEKKKR